MELTYKDWNIEALYGYKPITTFYMDFSIADHYGVAAIKDTYKRAMEAWKEDYKYLTELVMVLNWKIWEHHGHNDKYAKLYNDLWGKADLYAQEHLKGAELSYFYRTTD
jgi:hypothetical protein